MLTCLGVEDSRVLLQYSSHQLHRTYHHQQWLIVESDFINLLKDTVGIVGGLNDIQDQVFSFFPHFNILFSQHPDQTGSCFVPWEFNLGFDDDGEGVFVELYGHGFYYSILAPEQAR